eukprot:960067-Rhodomonas_salina.1
MPLSLASRAVPWKSADMAAQQNGDAYGTSRFTCNSCDYKTSFHYDEASDPYYYETRDWSRNPVVGTLFAFSSLSLTTFSASFSSFLLYHSFPCLLPLELFASIATRKTNGKDAWQRQVAHDYAGLPPVTIDPDGSENRRRQAADKEGEWKKVDGKWVPA